jgi:hypothetical protein
VNAGAHATMSTVSNGTVVAHSMSHQQELNVVNVVRTEIPYTHTSAYVCGVGGIATDSCYNMANQIRLLDSGLQV